MSFNVSTQTSLGNAQPLMVLCYQEELLRGVLPMVRPWFVQVALQAIGNTFQLPVRLVLPRRFLIRKRLAKGYKSDWRLQKSEPV